MKTTIKGLWEEFEQACLQEASDRQRREAMTAFYAGIAGLLKLQSDLAESGMPVPDAVAMIDQWKNEIAVFSQAMMEVAAAAITQEIINHVSKKEQPKKD